MWTFDHDAARDYEDERPVNRCTCGRDSSHADSDPCEECPIHGGATEEDAE